ncbi:MAG: serine hydrolase domain-containing protein [Flavobacteriaceae bacterium]
MKKVKYLVALILLGVLFIVFSNYSKLNIISGYASKSLASNYFVSGSNLNYIQANDLNFSPIDLASLAVDDVDQSASASVFGMMNRTSVYREGLGTVLVNDTYDPEAPYLIPVRNQPTLEASFPYGNGPDKDTVFANVDYKELEAIVADAFDGPSDEVKRQTRSVLVVYKDHIIGERYQEPFNQSTKILGWSMNKSIQSTLMGILIDQQGFDIYAPAPIEEWKDDERFQITTHNLLQMNSGLSWEEDYNTISDVTRMLFLDSDMTQSQTLQKLAHTPNTHWNYSSGTTNVLSGITRKQFETHQEYLDFPYSQLIDKIGMYSMLLEADLDGNYVTSSYGWATTRDWAKFGLLYLHRGNWNGTRVFQETWVDYVTTPTPTSKGRYGGQFWLNAQGHYPRLPKNMYSANGYQGQRVAIFPDQDLVIVRTGLGDESVFDFESFCSDIINAIE